MKKKTRQLYDIIMWEQPKKKVGKDEWKKISACGAPPGVYTPNMSKEDAARWKGWE